MRSFIRNLTIYECCKNDENNNPWLIRIRLRIIYLQLMTYPQPSSDQQHEQEEEQQQQESTTNNDWPW